MSQVLRLHCSNDRFAVSCNSLIRGILAASRFGQKICIYLSSRKTPTAPVKPFSVSAVTADGTCLILRILQQGNQ